MDATFPNAWVKVTYCCPTRHDDIYASGSRGMFGHEVWAWLQEQTRFGKPVLVTGIEEYPPVKTET